MPLKKQKGSMAHNMHELKEDNQKKGSAKGAGGMPRSHKQMLAIALKLAGKSKKSK